jgi:ATP-dependent RNA circularization protein (DNA/RNA ligase family)
MDIFTTTLHGIIDQINMEHKLGVIMGDMNVDLLKYSSHDATDIYMSMAYFPGVLFHVF